MAARRRIAALETELALHRRATELLKEAVPPKARFAAAAAVTAEGLPAQVAYRVVDVSKAGSTPGGPGRRRHARCATPG